MYRYVRSTGPTEANIMVVGEAPGLHEEQTGVPFSGPSGNLLSTAMHSASISRSECYITNAVRYRPPGNSLVPSFVTKIPKSKSKLNELIGKGYEEFRGVMVQHFVVDHVRELEQEIDAVRPNVIVALGNWAMYFLTGKSGITTWRGSLLQVEIKGRVYKVIPTVHPAFVLRMYTWLMDLGNDLVRVRKESYSSSVDMPTYNLVLRPSFEQVMGTLTKLMNDIRLGKQEFITCDIETRHRQIACIGIGWSKTDAICIPIMSVDNPSGYWSEQEELDIILTLKKLLGGRSHVINQNYLYDAFYIAAQWGFRSIPVMDTMLAQNVLLPGKEKSLAYLASVYADKYIFWKDEGREWNRGQPEDQLWHYNALDCTYTYEVGVALREQIESEGLQGQLAFQMSMFEPVLDMMLRGVRVDKARKQSMVEELTTAIKEREQEIETMLGHKVNPRSSKQLSKLFYTDFKVQTVYGRGTGNPTVGSEALDTISKRQPLLVPIISRIHEIRTMSIYKSTFLSTDGPPDRLYSSFNIAGTNTFRFSSSSNPFGWGTNMQNVPKWDEDDPAKANLPDIRKVIVPDPGKTLVDIDLSKADLHVVVWESGDQDLMDMLSSGVNVYKENAKGLGMPYHNAKMFIHGTNYGATARTIGMETGISTRDAERLQAEWFAKHPGIREWHKRIKHELVTTRRIYNRFGFRRVFLGRIDDHAFKEALAWVPQSTVAHVVNTALLRIWDKYRKDVDILMQVHDSLVVQVSDVSIVPSLCECFRVVVPYKEPLVIPADAKVSDTSWGDMKPYGTIDTELMVP